MKLILIGLPLALAPIISWATANCADHLDSQQIMAHLAHVFDQDPEALMREAQERPQDDQVTAYKNNLGHKPGRVIPVARLLPAQNDLKTFRDGEKVTSADSSEFDLDHDLPRAHRDLITSLRAGDLIEMSNGEKIKLGEFNHWGGTTHLFNIAGDPSALIRLPRAVRIKFTNPWYATREEKTAYFYRIFAHVVEEQKYLGLPLIEAKVRDGLVLVENLRPFESAAALANTYRDQSTTGAISADVIEKRAALIKFLLSLRGKVGITDVHLDAIVWRPAIHQWRIADFGDISRGAVAADQVSPAYRNLIQEATKRFAITRAELTPRYAPAAPTTHDAFFSTAALPIPLRGIVTPIVTPLKANRRGLDQDGLSHLIDHVLNGGVRGIMVLGTTGEGAYLPDPLKFELIRETCRLVHQRDERVPVLVNVSAPQRITTSRLIAAARSSGASAVVLSPPAEAELTQDQLLEYVRSVAAETSLPVFLYNIPQMTRARYEPETVVRASQIPGVVGIKDSSGDIEYFRELKRLLAASPNFSIMVGSESILAQALSEGAHGAVSGSSNVRPRMFETLYRSVLMGHVVQAHASIKTVEQWKESLKKISTTPNSAIAIFKTALHVIGLIQSDKLITSEMEMSIEQSKMIKALIQNSGEFADE